MPPKKPQPSRTESKAKADGSEEAPLQAVILADSYNRRFEVLCADQPRVLLPLCSTPLLAWTLESLSLSKVKQVFIFCGVHADKIREYVSTSPFRLMLDIQCLSSQTARSSGDALRELDSMGVLNGEQPFILVHSPLISNYDFSKMLDEHQKRKAEDKNYILTMGVGRGGRRHPESPIMLVHPPSSRLLHYAQHALSHPTSSSTNNSTSSRISFPSSLFLDPFPPSIDTYEIWSGITSKDQYRRGGYRDLGVDICEAEVPALCTENFDWHDLRRHVVNGVLTSELLGKKIAVHLVGKEISLDSVGSGGDIRNGDGGRYVDRVRDTRTFGQISRDVLRRWAFPLVPDLNEPGGVQYELREGNVYIARDTVTLGRFTTLHGPLLIGPRTQLDRNVHVHQSTIGKDCNIGHDTYISHSYIFDDVVIGSNCSMEECIIGKGVVIKDGSSIGRGVLIGDGVVIGKGVVVPPFARVGRERWRAEGWEEDDLDPEEDKAEDARRLEVLGGESSGYLWPQEEEEEGTPNSDSEDEGEDPYENPRNKKLLQLGRTLSNLSNDSLISLSTLSKASEDSSPPDSPISMASSTSLPDIPGLAIDAVPPEFHIEALASLERAYEEDHSIENAMLEMRTLVMGYNAGIDRAREEVSRFLMGKNNLQGGAGEILKDGIRIWGRWGKMAVTLSPDLTNIVGDIQAYCVQHESHRPWFGIFLRAIYEADIIAEEDLVEWRSLSASKGEGAKEVERPIWLEVYQKGKVYVDVLEQMESDDDDDEESEEEDKDE